MVRGREREGEGERGRERERKGEREWRGSVTIRNELLVWHQVQGPTEEVAMATEREPVHDGSEH